MTTRRNLVAATLIAAGALFDWLSTPGQSARGQEKAVPAKDQGDDALGKFGHNRGPTPIDKQTVIRMNRDTLYSAAVFDLDAGPVTITLPEAGKRFLSMQVINQDHYTPAVVYGGD